MRLIPSRYVGDMCSRPSTSFPDLMRWSVVASVFSSTAIVVHSSTGRGDWLRLPAICAKALEVAAAECAAILAQQQLRSKERYQFGRGGVAKRALDEAMSHHRPHIRG